MDLKSDLVLGLSSSLIIAGTFQVLNRHIHLVTTTVNIFIIADYSIEKCISSSLAISFLWEGDPKLGEHGKLLNHLESLDSFCGVDLDLRGSSVSCSRYLGIIYPLLIY